MKVATFPQCCGIRLFTEFGHTDTAATNTKFTNEEVTQFLNTHEEDEYTAKQRAINMIVLNDEQRVIFKKLLFDRGYRSLKKAGFYHPAHNTRIYIYVKENHPDKEAA